MNVSDIEQQLYRAIQEGQLTRRQLLKRATVLGLSAPVIASLLAACGDDDDDEPPAVDPEPDDDDDVEDEVEDDDTEDEPAPDDDDEEDEPDDEPPAVGGHLIAANEANPNSFDPAQMVGLPPRRIGRCIYNALVGVDEEGVVQPELVEDWEQPDESSYLLYLREGVMFHDGTPFNADAVKFHFDRHLDPDTNSLRRGELTVVESAEVVDEYTVEVRMQQPFAPFLAALFDWSGFVVSPTAVEELGEDYSFNPVGTGPFRMVEHIPDQHTIVERNPDYWEEGLPRLERITFRPVPTDSTRLTELRTGGVHLAEDIPYQDVERLQDTDEIVLSIREGFRFDYFHFVSDQEPYGSNQHFRNAVQWAIDREEILQGALFGIGSVGYQPFFPGTAFHDPDFRPYERDLDRAREELELSGVDLPVSLTVGVTTDPVKQRVTQVVQAQLAQIDINIEIEQMDVAAYRERVLDRADNFYTAFGWWGWRPDPDQYLSTLMHSASANNYGNIDSPRIDELLAQGRTVTDLGERMEIYSELREILAEENIYIYYWEGPNIKGISPSVRDFEHRPDGIIRYQFLSLEE